MIKGSIIGLGKMGLSHAAIIAAHPDVNLVAVCDANTFVLDAIKKHGIGNTYTDYQEMLSKEKPDFVIIATPTRFHYPMVKFALENGVHVFCEKPLTILAAEGEELTRIAKDKGLINQVGYHNHFIGTFRELKRLMGLKVLGDLVTFKGEAYGPVVVKEKASSWRSKPEEGGGCLYDYASHVINLIQEVIGRPRKIKGAILKSIFSKGVEDAVYALLSLDSGLEGVLSVNWSDDSYRKMTTSITVEGKNGKIICDATEMKIYLREPIPSAGLEKGWSTKYITDFAIPVNFYLRGEEYSAQLDYFVECVINKKSPIYNSFEQASYTDNVIEKIVKASKN